MGSEQSQHANAARSNNIHRRINPGGNSNIVRLQRGNTIAVSSEHNISSPHEEAGTSSINSNSRPVSPPISVCSDSDLPYTSYTDKPIGDSPKFRNKNQTNYRNVRAAASQPSKKSAILQKAKAKSFAHDIVVVRGANKKTGIEKDPDIQRLQSIPQFLPVMRGTLSLPANRDPEVLERLQPIHLQNICNRMEIHLNMSANQVAAEQSQITTRIKEVDYEAAKVFNSYTEKQKLYATYAEQFSKIHHITQQLSRCNILLNQNLESMQILNDMLEIEDRFPPFVWKTIDDIKEN